MKTFRGELCCSPSNLIQTERAKTPLQKYLTIYFLKLIWLWLMISRMTIMPLSSADVVSNWWLVINSTLIHSFFCMGVVKELFLSLVSLISACFCPGLSLTWQVIMLLSRNKRNISMQILKRHFGPTHGVNRARLREQEHLFRYRA